ncbi:hypothetical protein ACFX19_014126 [Malus domestica]
MSGAMKEEGVRGNQKEGAAALLRFCLKIFDKIIMEGEGGYQSIRYGGGDGKWVGARWVGKSVEWVRLDFE